MTTSLLFSLVLPSVAVDGEDQPIRMDFGNPPTEMQEGETGKSITAALETKPEFKTKTPKYTVQWDSSNSKIISVAPVAGKNNAIVSATLNASELFEFDTDTPIEITLYVEDTANGVAATGSFTVTAKAPPRIVDFKITPKGDSETNLNDTTLSIRETKYIDLQTVITYENGKVVTNAPVEWTSSTNFVSVGKSNGRVTGSRKSTSDTRITATYRSLTRAVNFRVVDDFSVSFVEPAAKPPTITLRPTDTYPNELEVKILPDDPLDNQSYQPVEWKSSNESVATVRQSSSDKNKATLTAGSTPGTADITATVVDTTGNTVTATCRVTVSARDTFLSSVRITPEQKDIKPLAIGTNEQLKLQANLVKFEKYDNSNNYNLSNEITSAATSDEVTWKSSNTAVAEVWRDGTVVAKGGGEATITVTTKSPIADGFPNAGEYATASVNIIVNQDLRRITLSNTRRVLQIRETLSADGSPKIEKESFELSVVNNPETAWPKLSFRWELDKNGIVSMSAATGEKNTITAVSPGTAIITVRGYEGNELKETATCEVTVTRPVTGITLDHSTLSLQKAQADTTIGTAKLKATLLPAGASGTITWLTSDNRYVRVSGRTDDPTSADVTAVEYTDKPITITARVGESPVYTATCTVTLAKTGVNKVTLVGLGDSSPKTASVSLGSSLQLSAVIDPKTATETDLIWSSSDENFATVNRNGKVTPQRKTEAGKPVIITVKSKQNETALDTVAVTVTAHQVTGVRLEPADPVTLEKVGDTQQFVGSLVPSTADDTLRWTVSGGTASSDGSTISNSVLSLKSGGSNKVVIVTGLAPGETDVLVNVGDFTTSTKVTVSGVTFEKDSVSVAVGRSEPVVKKLFGRAKTLNDKDWEWSSDNDSVARVNPSTGMVSGIKPGTAKITCKNGSYSAVIPVTVSESSATVLSYKMTDEDEGYSFGSKLVNDIRDQCKTAFEGSELNYVTNLSVPPSQGTLYYGYVSETNPGQGVASSDKFYYRTSATGLAGLQDVFRYATGGPSDKLLSDVTFVPAAGFSGVADISYTAFAENDKDIAGSIQITVPAASELTYNSPNGEAIRFVTNDFSTLSQTSTGYPISSVRFNAPSDRYGYLYYEHAGGDVYGSNITSGQRFYASSTPSLDSVSFVPRSGYTGTFPLTFTGWNTNGGSFTGTIRITVKSTGEGEGDITYNTLSGSRVYFDASDFQTLCRSATGGKLNYIQFTALPTVSNSSSSSTSNPAVLYHGSGSGSGSRVGTSSSIYATSSGSRWKIDDVYLLPSSSFTGSVTIPFKGWDTDRKTFEGTVLVNVTQDGGTAATIYMTCTGLPLVFSRASFDDACKDALPAALQSVRFHIPGSNSGTLYEYFNDLNDRKALSSNQDIAAADLVKLSYLPKGESSGTVYLSYTATDEKGNVCDGQVRITSEPNSVSLYFVDLDNTVWAIPSINFLRTYGVVNGKGKKRFQPNDTLKRGDFVLMLARAFDFLRSGTESFPDVPQDSYYAGAIAAAKSLNLVRGSGSNGSFRPEENITRQEAATILFRVLQRERNLSAADTGYLTSFSDSGLIESYAQTALATLVRDGIFEGSGGRLYPYSPLTRAQMAVILHRSIT